MTTTTGAMVSVLLLLVILVLRATSGVAVDVVGWSAPSEVLEINFESLHTGNQYTQIEEVYNRVVWLSRHKVVMAKQTGEGQPPPKWLRVVARGRGTEVSMLALRQDNLYLAGFTDRSGAWYTFANKVKAQYNLIPGATVLDFGDNYAGLVGYGGWRSLRDVKVGRESTLRAIATMYSYDHSPQADQGCLPRAGRRGHGSDGVRGEPPSAHLPRHPGQLDRRRLPPLPRLQTVSCALMVATQHGNQWDSEKNEAHALKTELSIRSLRAAADAASLLLWPDNEMCSEKINWLK